MDVYVYCGDCGAIGPSDEPKSRTVKAWNTRTDGWIPTSERLPDEGDWVLVWNGSYQMVGEIAENKSFYDNCDGLEISGATHWRPLPAPPEEE